MEVNMPGFDGTGPRGGGRRGQGLGRRNRYGQGFEGGFGQPPAPEGQGQMYEYTLEELQERKAALEKEILWIEDRIKEFVDQTPETGKGK